MFAYTTVTNIFGFHRAGRCRGGETQQAATFGKELRFQPQPLIVSLKHMCTSIHKYVYIYIHVYMCTQVYKTTTTTAAAAATTSSSTTTTTPTTTTTIIIIIITTTTTTTTSTTTVDGRNIQTLCYRSNPRPPKFNVDVASGA